MLRRRIGALVERRAEPPSNRARLPRAVTVHKPAFPDLVALSLAVRHHVDDNPRRERISR